MLVYELFKLLDQKYPIALQEPWDESGWIIKTKNYLKDQINHILVCLDINQLTIQEAINRKCNVIIAHHPIFLNNDQFNLTKIEKQNVALIKKNKINVIALHTNFDNSLEGLNFFIGKKLNLTNIKKFPNHCIFTGQFSKSIKLKKIAKKLKQSFHLNRVIYDKKFKNNEISKIAWCSGSGYSEFKSEIDNLKKTVDCLLTGDIKWHDWQLSTQYSFPTIDAGHDLENEFVQTIKQKLLCHFNSEIICEIPKTKLLKLEVLK